MSGVGSTEPHQEGRAGSTGASREKSSGVGSTEPHQEGRAGSTGASRSSGVGSTEPHQEGRAGSAGASRSKARELAAFVPDCAVLFKRLLADPRVPRRAKAALWLVVPYLALPFDLIPDFIPVVGQLDDALVAAAAVGYVVRAAGRGVVEELWPGSEAGLRVVLTLA